MTQKCRTYILATVLVLSLLNGTLQPAGHAWPPTQAQALRVVLAEIFTASW